MTELSSTMVVSGADMAAAFEQTRSFVETSEYRISTASRTAPGDVEVHTVDTDIFYVFEGEGTLVTGGEMLEPRTVSKNEIRGTAISGGQTRVVAKGDLIVIPRTEPHWFKEITRAPFVYLVIKSTSR